MVAKEFGCPFNAASLNNFKPLLVEPDPSNLKPSSFLRLSGLSVKPITLLVYNAHHKLNRISDN
jgi:hypothetical protein